MRPAETNAKPAQKKKAKPGRLSPEEARRLARAVVKAGGGEIEVKAPQRNARDFDDPKRQPGLVKSPAYRKDVRAEYDARSPEERRHIARDAEREEGAAAREIDRYSSEKRRGVRLQKAALASLDGTDPLTDEERKGLRILQRKELRGALSIASSIDSLEAPDRGPNLDLVKKIIDRIGTGNVPTGRDTGVSNSEALAKGASAARNVLQFANRGSRAAALPVDQLAAGMKVAGRADAHLTPSQDAAAKGAIEGTSKLLEQLTRPLSGTVGGIRAAVRGDNVLEGAVAGAKENDQSFGDLLTDLGVSPDLAGAAGLALDLTLDPLNRVSLSVKPAAEQKALSAQAKEARRQARVIAQARKRGEFTDEELQDLRRFAEQAIRNEGEKAARSVKPGRALQAGVHVPARGIKSVNVPGTRAVGERVGKLARRVVQTDRGNQVARISPKTAPKGMVRAESDALRDMEAESRAVLTRVSDRFNRLARLVARETGRDVDRYRRVIHAIEGGTVDQLPEQLGRTARELTKAFDEAADVAADYGIRLQLRDLAVPSRDLKDLLGRARAAVDKTVRSAGRQRSEAAAELRGLDAARPASQVPQTRPVVRANERLDEVLARADGEGVLSDDSDVFWERYGKELELIERQLAVGLGSSRLTPRRSRVVSRLEDAEQRGAAVNAQRAELTAGPPTTATEERHLLETIAKVGAVTRRNELREDAERLLARVDASPPPVGYVPRQYERHLEDPASSPAGPSGPSQAFGHAEQRLDRRRLEDIEREFAERGKQLPFSVDLPQLVGAYGVKLARRLASAHLFRGVQARFGAAPTHDILEAGGVDLWRVSHGRYSRMSDDDVAAVRRAVASGDVPDDVIAFPTAVSRELEVRLRHHDGNPLMADYDRLLRGWKIASTIARPGYFINTAVGNAWQAYLLDASPADFGRGWKALTALVADERRATRLNGTPLSRFLDRVMPNATVKVLGVPTPVRDLIEEAQAVGLVRAGSRISDPSELSLEQQARRNVLTRIRPLEAAGSLAEDLDDAAKLALFIKGRRMGLDPRQAGKHALLGMINYADLSEVERRVFKRLMPYYVFTSRNVPMQVKRIAARPGKLANFEKFRQALAEHAGLGPDWLADLTDSDQERMPVPVPGWKPGGFQAYRYLRLPSEDLSRLTPLLGGDVVRVLKRYAADLTPAIKLPIELSLNQRFDFDRDIQNPTGRQDEAGALLRNVMRLAGGGEKDQVDPRTGKRYAGVDARVVHLLRTLGGSYGALVLSAGTETKDRGGQTFGMRLLNQATGQGGNAPDPLDTQVSRLYDAKDKAERAAARLRNEGRQDTADYIRVQDRLDDIGRGLTKLRAALGYPDDRRQVGEVRRRELLTVREGPEVRAFKAKYGLD
ncbi:hypothetical protein [Conexibacter sp. SYSU D00693]|uniref:hypothetical protein n=1 Tax=Conexibacter sp. SYSU D00693 TaxID=2812560 RepID=UPI00196B6A61|nr:hypothetical protein [Conexibacter sp. SYSU D00693]